jgi:hypothetical protein
VGLRLVDRRRCCGPGRPTRPGGRRRGGGRTPGRCSRCGNRRGRRLSAGSEREWRRPVRRTARGVRGRPTDCHLRDAVGTEDLRKQQPRRTGGCRLPRRTPHFRATIHCAFSADHPSPCVAASHHHASPAAADPIYGARLPRTAAGAVAYPHAGRCGRACPAGFASRVLTGHRRLHTSRSRHTVRARHDTARPGGSRPAGVPVLRCRALPTAAQRPGR